jgi:uncharacterized protein YbaA (DUF1428 family)
MSYVDGFVLPVPKKKIREYRKLARKAGRIWLEHGALEFRECGGDDLRVKGIVPFPRLAKAKPNETVFFSWIVYKSKGHRDRVNKKVMSDPRMHMAPQSMPFDSKRMAYGGFQVMVDLKARKRS